MEHPIVKYQVLTEEQILGVCHDSLIYCNHAVKEASEKINTSLARCDAMDKMAELYRKQSHK